MALNTNPSGLWSLDGIDLWDGFKTIIEKGTADFLKYAPAKAGVSYNWQGANGVEVDLTAPKYDARQISLQCVICEFSNAAILENHDALIQQLRGDGLHMFRIGTHGWDRVYACQFLHCDNYTAISPMPANDLIPGDRKYRFTMVLQEPVPESSNTTSRIITEDGRYIVT